MKRRYLFGLGGLFGALSFAPKVIAAPSPHVVSVLVVNASAITANFKVPTEYGVFDVELPPNANLYLTPKEARETTAVGPRDIIVVQVFSDHAMYSSRLISDHPDFPEVTASMPVHLIP